MNTQEKNKAGKGNNESQGSWGAGRAEWKPESGMSFPELHLGGTLFIKKCYLLLNASFE